MPAARRLRHGLASFLDHGPITRAWKWNFSGLLCFVHACRSFLPFSGRRSHWSGCANVATCCSARSFFLTTLCLQVVWWLRQCCSVNAVAVHCVSQRIGALVVIRVAFEFDVCLCAGAFALCKPEVSYVVWIAASRWLVGCVCALVVLRFALQWSLCAPKIVRQYLRCEILCNFGAFHFSFMGSHFISLASRSGSWSRNFNRHQEEEMSRERERGAKRKRWGERRINRRRDVKRKYAMRKRCQEKRCQEQNLNTHLFCPVAPYLVKFPSPVLLV